MFLFRDIHVNDLNQGIIHSSLNSKKHDRINLENSLHKMAH